MSRIITESGMNFIADNAFHIEKSPAYTKLGKCVKSVEFVRLKGDKLLFIEAKSSFPNPNNPTSNPENGNKTGSELFQEEIIDIYDKFTHSLNLYLAVYVGVTEYRLPQEHLPSDKVSLAFVLVINGFERSWCEEIERALRNKIGKSVCLSRIWKPEVYVINQESASKRHLTKA